MSETEAILHQIAEATSQTWERVEQVVSALRDAIDGLFLDGYTIVAPPFSLTYKNDPVAPIFAERVEGASSDEIEAWHLGNAGATAQWLGVPLSVYLRHPVASDLGVLIELLDALDLADDSPEGIDAVAIAEAWFDTFQEERSYRLGSVGLERDLEAWLIHHTERLVQIGYDVRLRRQQFVLPDRRRPDLVFDLTDPDGSLGTLIVELKATGGYLEAVDQLVGYLDAFRSLGLAGGVLRGLLVADGFPPEVLAYADEKGVDTSTLTELGYRRDLAANLKTTVATPRQPSSSALSAQQIGATVSRVYRMFHGMDSDQTKPLATLVFTDAGLCSWVSDEGAFTMLVPGHIFTLTLDEITGVMNSHAFVPISEQEPEYFDAIEAANDFAYPWDASVRATEAAADFLRAVWELRKDITVVPPRHLANYLQRNPDELQGDDDLPEHIGTAADAIEDLPGAVIEWAAPEGYNGGVENFLLDAERLFLSVSRRLRRLQPESAGTA